MEHYLSLPLLTSQPSRQFAAHSCNLSIGHTQPKQLGIVGCVVVAGCTGIDCLPQPSGILLRSSIVAGNHFGHRISSARQFSRQCSAKSSWPDDRDFQIGRHCRENSSGEPFLANFAALRRSQRTPAKSARRAKKTDHRNFGVCRSARCLTSRILFPCQNRLPVNLDRSRA
jgi:hypothetical protein